MTFILEANSYQLSFPQKSYRDTDNVKLIPAMWH
jgi:hypothetical protein